MGRTFYAIVDGSYLFQTQSGGKVRAEIRGEACRIRDGSRTGETWDLR